MKRRWKPEATVAAKQLPWNKAVRDFKRDLIQRTLTQTAGNRTRAANALRLQRTYLVRLIRELEIKPPSRPQSK